MQEAKNKFGAKEGYLDEYLIASSAEKAALFIKWDTGGTSPFASQIFLQQPILLYWANYNIRSRLNRQLILEKRGRMAESHLADDFGGRVAQEAEIIFRKTWWDRGDT